MAKYSLKTIGMHQTGDRTVDLGGYWAEVAVAAWYAHSFFKTQSRFVTAATALSSAALPYAAMGGMKAVSKEWRNRGAAPFLMAVGPVVGVQLAGLVRLFGPLRSGAFGKLNRAVAVLSGVAAADALVMKGGVASLFFSG